jgi:hypothetical protein
MLNLEGGDVGVGGKFVVELKKRKRSRVWRRPVDQLEDRGKDFIL